MRFVWWLFGAHAVALVFGLAGLLIALPNPHLWATSPLGVQTFVFGMEHAGALHIVLGALTMAAYGVVRIGWRPTILFFCLATTLSLGMELLGTGTGWPFGTYSYTTGLGQKIGGQVPYTIPLSWFSMGFAGWLLGLGIARRQGWRPVQLVAVLLGVWLLTIWDLVLDPAMAHESLPIQFWVWHQTGPYFGMPLQNFAGWSLTGLLFMGLSALWSRPAVDVDQLSARLPFWFYVVNTLFAMVLSASVGLWLPILISAVAGLVPAALALGGPSSHVDRRAAMGSPT